MNELTYAQTREVVATLLEIDARFLQKAEIIDAMRNIDAIPSEPSKFEEVCAFIDEMYCTYRQRGSKDAYDFCYAINECLPELKDATVTVDDLRLLDWGKVFELTDSIDY